MSSTNIVDGVVDGQGDDGAERLPHLPVVLSVQHHPAGRVDGVRPEAGVEGIVVVKLDFQTDEAKGIQHFDFEIHSGSNVTIKSLGQDSIHRYNRVLV